MRKVTMKKGLSVIFAIVMAVGMMAGCGSGETKENDNNKQTSEVSNVGSETAGGSYTDYSAGFPETVTIQIPVYDRAFEGWDVTDNYYTRWIQSEFGDKYNINVEYVGIGRSTEIQDFMQLIAAGNAPDIIFHYDMPQAVNYYGEGAMQALDLAEIEYYAPTYYANMKDTINKYGVLEDQNVFFFAEREAIYYNYVTLIRQDWLDAVGADMPTNRAELEEVAKKWKDAGLGTIGEKLWVASFTMEYPFMDGSATEEEYAKYLDLNVAPLTWKPTENYLRTLNAEYNEGILDEEFYLVKDDASWKAEFVAGNVGTYQFFINSSTDVITSLLANDSDAKVAVLDPGALGETGNNYYYEYPPYGMIMGINSTTSAEERAAVWMFLDWMSQPENLFYLQNGIEGENYTLEDGIAVPVADFAGESKLSQNNNKDYWCLVAEVANYGEEEMNYKANLRTLAPAGYENLIEDSYSYTTADAEYGVITPIFTKVVESTGEYTADLNSMWQEFSTDLITCDPEEFDEKYAEYCQEYLDSGYQEILDEKAALYAEGSYIAE
ncbi:MAG: extracellular solute-binding protein [Roseburia sp.]|nr:extracellular solute-binding protein [Roseburia sp.]